MATRGSVGTWPVLAMLERSIDALVQSLMAGVVECHATELSFQHWLLVAHWLFAQIPLLLQLLIAAGQCRLLLSSSPSSR